MSCRADVRRESILTWGFFGAHVRKHSCQLELSEGGFGVVHCASKRCKSSCYFFSDFPVVACVSLRVVRGIECIGQ